MEPLRSANVLPTWIIVVVIVVAMAFNILPYLLLDRHAPPGGQFMWSTFNLEDVSLYLSKMNDGVAGRWLTTDRYTTESNAPSLIHFPYLLLGRVSAATGVSPVIVLWSARVLLGVLLLLVIARFVRLVAPTRTHGTISFLLLAFGSGLGWFIPIRDVPIDRWLPDAVAFERFTDLPHILLAHILLIFGVSLLIAPFCHPRWNILSLVVLTVVLGFIVPFHVPILFLVALILWLLRSRRAGRLDVGWHPVAAIVVGSIPPLLYFAWLDRTNVVFRAIAAQSLVPMPSVVSLTVGLGLIGVFALIGLFTATRREESAWDVIILWLLVVLALAYSPFNDQRRFFQSAAYVPLALLAAEGMIVSFSRFSRRRFFQLIVAVVFLSVISNLYWVRDTLRLARRVPQGYYVDGSLTRTFRWLKGHASEGTNVLASYRTGNLVPAFSDATSFLGHRVQTVQYVTKWFEVDAFYFGQMSSTEAEQFLRSNHIRFVLYTSVERSQRFPDPIRFNPFLIPRFVDGEAKVYEFISG